MGRLGEAFPEVVQDDPPRLTRRKSQPRQFCGHWRSVGVNYSELRKLNKQDHRSHWFYLPRVEDGTAFVQATLEGR